MFKHILVPIDLSDRNERAIRTALALARQMRARVTLLHVIQRVPDLPFGELRDFYERLETASVGKLVPVARRFAARRVRVDTEVCIGEPARDIVRVAAKHAIDLIVMGSHKVRVGRPAAGWGTTSYKVGVFCRCPILLVK
jgi:nucleotide-binding universal stress UspA family protein